MTIYGETASGLANSEGISQQEAQDIIDKLMKAYPLLDKKIQDTQKMAETKHYVETIAGNRRRLDKINSNDKAI